MALHLYCYPAGFQFLPYEFCFPHGEGLVPDTGSRPSLHQNLHQEVSHLLCPRPTQALRAVQAYEWFFYTVPQYRSLLSQK